MLWTIDVEASKEAVALRRRGERTVPNGRRVYDPEKIEKGSMVVPVNVVPPKPQPKPPPPPPARTK